MPNSSSSVTLEYGKCSRSRLRSSTKFIVVTNNSIARQCAVHSPRMVVQDLQDSYQNEANGTHDPPRNDAMHTGHGNFQGERSTCTEGTDEQSHANAAQGQEPPHQSNSYIDEDWEVVDARPILPKAAFFMGDLRDGLSMVSKNDLMFDRFNPTLSAVLKCFMIHRTAENCRVCLVDSLPNHHLDACILNSLSLPSTLDS